MNRFNFTPVPQESQNEPPKSDQPISEHRTKTLRNITQPSQKSVPPVNATLANIRRITQSDLPTVTPSRPPLNRVNGPRRDTPVMPIDTTNNLLESCREVRKNVDAQFRRIEDELLDFLNPTDSTPQEEQDPLFRSRLLPSTNPPPDGEYKFINQQRASVLPKTKSFQAAFNDLRPKEKFLLLELYSYVNEEDVFNKEFYRLANSSDSILVSSLASLLHERIIKLPKPCDKNDWVITEFDESELKQRYFLLPVVPISDFPDNFSAMQQVPLRYILLANPVMIK